MPRNAESQKPRPAGIGRLSGLLAGCLLAALPLAGGCGPATGSAQAPGSTTAPGSATTTDASADGTAGPAPATTGPDSKPGLPGAGSEPTKSRGETVIAWIKELGPLGGGADGRKDESLAALTLGECEHALEAAEFFDEPAVTLFRGAAHGCLAALRGRAGEWPQAEAALAAVRPQASRLDCLDLVVYGLLQRMVDLHQRNPAARFVMGQPGHATAAACPRILELVPDHGPIDGGYPVRIVGENLPARAVVHFGQYTVTLTTTAGREGVVTAPPGVVDAAEPHVSVWADGWPWGPMHSPLFTYEQPAAAPPTTTATAPATPG